MSFGLPPLLLSCAGQSSNQPPGREVRTLFFNFAHENTPGKSYFLVSNGQTYPLNPVLQAPHVLHKAKAGNNFLSGIPDKKITHYIEDIEFANNSVSLCYIGSSIAGKPGAWSMSMIYLHLPESGADYAFNATSSSIPLSNKRAFYNQPAAQSATDLCNENVLIDSHSHAATLVMLHPDLLSGEPNSAYYIYTNHVGTGSLTKKLALMLQRLGPALPATSPGTRNVSGWATMQPILDDKNAPIINPGNNLIQYFPDWHSSVDLDAAPAMVEHITGTRNDPALGATLVRGSTNNAKDVIGKLWFQRDGFTSVNPSSSQVGAVQGDNVALTLLDQSPESGLDVTVKVSGQGAGVTAEMSFSNSFLRYLGLYIQFIDDKQQVIPLGRIASYPNNIQDNHNVFLDTATEMFLGMAPPELTILGIPVADGTDTVSIKVPPEATHIRILSSGLSLGLVAPNTYPDTIAAGVAMTAIINYGFTLLFMVAGAASASTVLQSFIRTLGIVVVEDIINLIGTDIANGDAPGNPDTWKKIALILAKLIAKPFAVATGKLLLQLTEYAIGIIGTATAASAVPVIGQIQRAISCVVGVIDLTHTTINLAQSPWTYVSELTLTHDLSVTLLKGKNPSFPSAATHYKVTALFDGATPYVQTFPLTSSGPANLPPVVFNGVPLGGKVNVSVAFSQQGAEDVLLGKGSTGLIDNTVGVQPSITVQQLEFPIGANTIYQHQQKTTLAANPQGGAPVHIWTATKNAPTAKVSNTSSGNQPGDLSTLNSITVREGSSEPTVKGYIGYTWRAFSGGITNCSNGAGGQLDQIANLNAPPGAAQEGYIVGRCGLPDGVRVAYSLLSHGTSNFYIDTNVDPVSNLPRNLLRRVQLDPVPVFDDPNSNQAWGKLNFPSAALLLHPAGKIISISIIDNQMETLTLPDAALPDNQAAVQLRAIRHGGEGNLPGLFSAPVTATISPDGVVLVLEQGNNRIQALDVNGNPVRYFTRQSQPYFLNLTATASGDVQYLDIAAEYTGFLYVLSCNQAQQLYRLDIYHPNQTGSAPISTTLNINAARLTVDFWRNVYTLNFEVLQLNGAFPAVTEPSVSLWTPCIVGNAC